MLCARAVPRTNEHLLAVRLSTEWPRDRRSLDPRTHPHWHGMGQRRLTGPATVNHFCGRALGTLQGCRISLLNIRTLQVGPFPSVSPETGIHPAAASTHLNACLILNQFSEKAGAGTLPAPNTGCLPAAPGRPMKRKQGHFGRGHSDPA
jgi:hypothetical protein